MTRRKKITRWEVPFTGDALTIDVRLRLGDRDVEASMCRGSIEKLWHLGPKRFFSGVFEVSSVRPRGPDWVEFVYNDGGDFVHVADTSESGHGYCTPSEVDEWMWHRGIRRFWARVFVDE